MISFILSMLLGVAQAEPPRASNIAVGVVCDPRLDCKKLTSVWLAGAAMFTGDLASHGMTLKFDTYAILSPGEYTQEQVDAMRNRLDILITFVPRLAPGTLGQASGIGVLHARPAEIFLAVNAHGSRYELAQTVHHELGHIFGAWHTDDGTMFWQSRDLCIGFNEDSVSSIRAYLASIRRALVSADDIIK